VEVGNGIACSGRCEKDVADLNEIIQRNRQQVHLAPVVFFSLSVLFGIIVALTTVSTFMEDSVTLGQILGLLLGWAIVIFCLVVGLKMRGKAEKAGYFSNG
jgi:hypothetical protein